ncbi:hypothetical protein ACX27_01825 [Nostoc piscinale CENA21]|uniref:Uncharacterized protein n=1 Tax=Nostoc piscinale CENA21 TaxID=224013 RepID=A0A0M5MKA5_9NOSO|nr:hypothetical protein [Nostoc piscinale]ALF51868.1 hypothetical protein ACX27_01825 [Nostoc piscinale CENA21]
MNNQILELPNDCRDLLMVSAADTRDIDGMIIINQASADWLGGKLDTGTYFDTLDHFGIDPYAHVRPVERLAYSQVVTVELFL